MKKVLVILLLTVIVLFVDLYGKLIFSQYIKPSDSLPKKVITSNSKKQGEGMPTEAVSKMLGRDSESVLALFGEPSRMEPSAYDYEWWVYNTDLSHYVQFGIWQNKVVTIYAGGQKIDVSPYHMGQKYGDIYELTPFSYEIALDYNNSSYEFELSESDVNEQPLIAIQNGWAQLYFDKFTQKLTGVRYMDNETLLKQRPYQIMYSGALMSPQALTAEQENEIETANAKQILDLTNIIRIREHLKPLAWDDEVAEVAYLHSKDMKDSSYFAHESPKFGSLGDRLTRGKVTFRTAGENIASNYTDGIAAVQGWLNSEGHRENVLNSKFNSLGVGVYDTYYTQNFTQK